MSWANSYVGIPFKWGGSDWDGCSCWGLMCLVLEEEFGKNIRRFEDIEEDIRVASDRKLPDDIPEEFERIDLSLVKDGDVFLLNSLVKGRLAPLHVGIAVGSDKVLHIMEGTNAVIERWKTMQFRWRIVDAYRAL